MAAGGRRHGRDLLCRCQQGGLTSSCGRAASSLVEGVGCGGCRPAGIRWPQKNDPPSSSCHCSAIIIDHVRRRCVDEVGNDHAAEVVVNFFWFSSTSSDVHFIWEHFPNLVFSPGCARRSRRQPSAPLLPGGGAGTRPSERRERRAVIATCRLGSSCSRGVRSSGSFGSRWNH